MTQTRMETDPFCPSSPSGRHAKLRVAGEIVRSKAREGICRYCRQKIIRAHEKSASWYSHIETPR